jgi:tetratricopeptide (TPR) repeat protein
MKSKQMEMASIVACSIVIASCASAEPDRVLEVVGMVNALQATGERLTFDLYKSSLQIELRPGRTSAALEKQLKEISETARTVTVRVSLQSGRIDNDLTKVVLNAQSLESIDGQVRWDNSRARPQRGRDGAPAGSLDRNLVDGITLATAGERREAIDALNKALASSGLSVPWRVISLRLRSNALQNQVYSEFSGPTPEGDRDLVRALADTQEWASRAPNDADAFYEIAAILRELGAYEEAVSTYRYIATRWADEDHWSSIRLGATERERGHYQNALDILDRYAKRADRPSSMAFHYHRAWTLGLLGRYEDAIAGLSTGLKGQPDYLWAFVRRSCNFARLGRFPEALADQRVAIALLEKFPESGAANQADLKHALDVQVQLAGQVAAGDSNPAPIGCTGYWRDQDIPRERSELLPSQSTYLSTIKLTDSA